MSQAGSRSFLELFLSIWDFLDEVHLNANEFQLSFVLNRDTSLYRICHIYHRGKTYQNAYVFLEEKSFHVYVDKINKRMRQPVSTEETRDELFLKKLDVP